MQSRAREGDLPRADLCLILGATVNSRLQEGPGSGHTIRCMTFQMLLHLPRGCAPVGAAGSPASQIFSLLRAVLLRRSLEGAAVS